jgi:hypothetical protein
MCRQMDKTSRRFIVLSAENTKMSARFTEMRTQIGRMSQQIACLPAENTRMSGRLTEMSQQMDQMRRPMTICGTSNGAIAP